MSLASRIPGPCPPASMQSTKPLISRILDRAHQATVLALIGGTLYLGYKIVDTIQGHKKDIREAAELAKSHNQIASQGSAMEN